MQPPALDLSLETVRRKPPAAKPHVIPVSEVSPSHDMAQVSPSHDMAQVMADLDPVLRPVSAHIYENADTWLTALIANSRSRAQPEIPSPTDDTGPCYAVPHLPRKDSKSKPVSVTSQAFDLSKVDNSDYVPMTPCNRSHSMRQI